jgi:hypothetical protein
MQQFRNLPIFVNSSAIKDSNTLPRPQRQVLRHRVAGRRKILWSVGETAPHGAEAHLSRSGRSPRSPESPVLEGREALE